MGCGVIKSILQDNKECFVCHTTYNLHEHHVFGASNRKHSERWGLKIFLCAKHHNMSDEGIHFNKALDTQVKQMAQAKFEETHTHQEFMSIFGRNYL